MLNNFAVGKVAAKTYYYEEVFLLLGTYCSVKQKAWSPHEIQFVVFLNCRVVYNNV